MDDQTLEELLNIITMRRYVNLYFNSVDKRNVRKSGEIVKMIIGGEQNKDYYINVDIRKLMESGSEEVNVLIKMINDDLAKAQFKHWIHDAISIDSVLEQLNKRLDKPALVVFHFFRDPEGEKEKDILRSVRKFIEMRDSLFLGILLVSSNRIDNWELFPYSSIDERHVKFFEYR